MIQAELLLVNLLVCLMHSWCWKQFQSLRVLSRFRQLLTFKRCELFFFYYMHTEIYSVKSYVVNFHTQMSSSQIRIANDFFSCARKMVRSIKSHMAVWVSRHNTAFRRRTLQLVTPLLPRAKVKKHPAKWSGIVAYISLSVKKIVGSRQNNSRRGKQQRDVS